MTVKHIPEPVASFIAAVNRHDEAAFLDAFTTTGAVDDWGRTFTGRDAIKAWSDNEFIGANGVLTPTEVSQQGEQVTVIGDWASTHANGLSRFIFDISGDKLTKMTIREG
ncbi:MAG: nuclear transport factor 2 family protein [Acidipropionibacterium sp.]|jgi:hypothetical protein|nr:nuclear transport factor 2 family protein [Acidipropionibacterium sp.]